MRTLSPLIAASVLSLLVPACTRPAPGPGRAESSRAASRDAEKAEGVHSCCDHDHGEAAETVELGLVTATGFRLRVSRIGALTVGGHAVVEIAYEGELPDGVAIRAWIGARDGRGALKSRAAFHAAERHFEADVEVPSGLADGAGLQIEVEVPGGGATVTTLPIA